VYRSPGEKGGFRASGERRILLRVGHENIQLTIDVYGHLIVDANKDAALAASAEASLLA